MEKGVKGVLKRFSSRLKSRHQINVINTGDALSQNRMKDVEEEDTVPIVTIAEHVIPVTRRQSVQQGIHVMRRLQDMSQGERQRPIPLREVEEESESNDNNNHNDE
eukprot:gene16413-18619_t